MHIQKNYRPEIDGLRAFAIITVLIFHFYPSIFPNGYLGVDVFFVISGYLITCGINSQLAAGSFSFRDFYSRRIRRIFPAVLAMLLATTGAAYVVLLSPDLLKYGQSLLASLGLVSNAYFFLTGGYFGGNDELKPLLHMWSLGVEEQFYLLFPLLIFLIAKVTKKFDARVVVIAVLSLISFGLNVFLRSIGGDMAAFFMLPTRAWQFGVGALFAMTAAPAMRSWVGHATAAIGVILIAWNFLWPPGSLPTATFVTLGTGLLLWRQWDSGTTFFRLMTLPLVRWIGVISFSLYLWHWPVISFFRYLNIHHVNAGLATTGLIGSLVLGHLSWKYIEEPFRKKLPGKLVYSLVIAANFVLLIACLAIVQKSGFPHRHSVDANKAAASIDANFRCPKEASFLYGGSRACFARLDPKKEYSFALVGNSHSQMYAPVYRNVLEKLGKGGLVIPLNGCLPTTDLNISANCLQFARLNYEAIIKDKAITTVVIGTTWEHSRLIDRAGKDISDRDTAFGKSIKDLVRELELNGKSTYLIGPVATPGTNFASILSRETAFGDVTRISTQLPRGEFESKFGMFVRDLEVALGSRFLQPHLTLCDAAACYFARDGATYYSDESHLSLDGAMRTAPAFEALSKQ
jgi:peptidoglycan/LPS O-acetylase OafA/YrhL